MSARREFLEDGMEELQEDLETPVFEWWNGAEIACIPASNERGAVVVSGGKEVTVQFTLYVLKKVFHSADTTLYTADDELMFTGDDNKPHPVSGRTLVFIGKTYRILMVSEDPSRSHYKLVLVDEYSGR